MKFVGPWTVHECTIHSWLGQIVRLGGKKKKNQKTQPMIQRAESKLAHNVDILSTLFDVYSWEFQFHFTDGIIKSYFHNYSILLLQIRILRKLQICSLIELDDLIISSSLAMLIVKLGSVWIQLKTENWKYCIKIIFKYVNSTMRSIFNKKIDEKWYL